MGEDANRTVHAQQAFEFTEVFAYKFDPVIYGQAHPRRLKLQEPDGPSTAGGKQARQSMVLLPDEGDRKLVVGWIDVSQKMSELRSYTVVSQQYKARFNTDLDLRKEEYEALLQDLRSFLRIQKIDHKIVEAQVGPQVAKKPAQAAEAPVEGGASTGALLAMLSIGILIGFALGYIVFVLL
jgi:hypothetical protein